MSIFRWIYSYSNIHTCRYSLRLYVSGAIIANHYNTLAQESRHRGPIKQCNAWEPAHRILGEEGLLSWRSWGQIVKGLHALVRSLGFPKGPLMFLSIEGKQMISQALIGCWKGHISRPGEGLEKVRLEA